MQMFIEPESWLGLRSERVVSAEFAPAVPRSNPQPPDSDETPFSWRAIRMAVRRRLRIPPGR